MALPTQTNTTKATKAKTPFPFWRSSLTALSLGCICNTFGFSAAFPFLPLMVETYALPGSLETWVGILVSGVFFLSFLLAPVWGTLADYYGKKSMVLRSGLGMTLVFALIGWAPHPVWFVVGFMLLGIFNGYVPASIALIASNTPREKIGFALSRMHAFATAGLTCGPAIGSVIAPFVRPQQRLFLMSAGCSFLAFFSALLGAKEEHTRPGKPLELHIIQDTLQILRLPQASQLVFLQYLFSFTFIGSASTISLYTLQLFRSLSTENVWHGLGLESWVGLTSLGLTASSTLAAPFWGKWLDRFNPEMVLAFGLMGGVLASIPTPFLATPLQVLIARLALGTLFCGVQPAVVTLLRTRSPAGMEGRTLAVGSSIGMLGNASGPLLAGLIAPWLGLRVFFVFHVALLTLGTLWWVRTQYRRIRATPPSV